MNTDKDLGKKIGQIQKNFHYRRKDEEAEKREWLPISLKPSNIQMHPAEKKKAQPGCLERVV
jgi:hypothetical protein